MALAVLNCGPRAAWLAETYLYELSLYTFVISPRQDELMLISGAAENIANRLLLGTHKPERLCLPGMRLLNAPSDAFFLIHLPTGAHVTTTFRTDGSHGNGRPCSHLPWWRADVAITPQEQDALDALPSMTPDAEMLLGALATRLCLRDPDRAWAIGTWFSPPPPPARTTRRSQGHSRRLAGGGDHWQLEWTSYPYPEDLVAALTHPRAGLRGTTVHVHSGTTQLAYGTARLALLPDRQRDRDRAAAVSRIWC
ncbi:hypothetical protein [Streptomyces sp. NPDC101115]|uniref:hypothetical protein n=1 Tax=Streptomyces sp. NPDC101115 TaxID=3366106 RepID=UPI0038060EF2